MFSSCQIFDPGYTGPYPSHRTFKSVDQNHYVRLFKRIATENYFLVVCLCCAMLSTFESMNEVLKCDDFNKSNWIVRSHYVCLSFHHFKNLKKVESGHACNICKLSRTPL